MAFVVPPYPYDRLAPAKAAASAVPGGLVDLSIGTPCDAPLPAVIAALGSSQSERGYPTSLGSTRFRNAAASWLSRRVNTVVDPETQVASCIGTKEFVATTPGYLRLLIDDRDTVLYPEVAYPTYEMGALLSGLRAVAVPVDDQWRIRLDAIDQSDIDRALCLWVNSPGNPCGQLDDLGAVASWGRANNVVVISDECYAEFTWADNPRSLLEHGTDGVLAVHSLSKRSNLAGVRVGFYAGDTRLVHHLSEVRKHAGFMVPGPAQLAGAVAYEDDAHVDAQRAVYLNRLQRFAPALRASGFDVELPDGGFYLWARPPHGDGWAAASWLATHAGILSSPGDFYSPASNGYVRLAMVQPDDRIDMAADRLSAAGVFGI